MHPPRIPRTHTSSSSACFLLALLVPIHPMHHPLSLNSSSYVCTIAPYRTIFSTFAEELTAWATQRMYEKFEKQQLDYDIGECVTRDDTIMKTVTSKKHGDKFIVTSAFECYHSPDAPKVGSYASACKQCWNQVYSGLLCIHCLVVLADKVIRTKHLRDKVSICRKAIKACHRH